MKDLRFLRLLRYLEESYHQSNCLLLRFPDLPIAFSFVHLIQATASAARGPGRCGFSDPISFLQSALEVHRPAQSARVGAAEAAGCLLGHLRRIAAAPMVVNG